MENLDSHGYITLPMCRSATVHFPLKDGQLNTLHLVECVSAHQKDDGPELVLGAWKFPRSLEWNTPDF